MEDFISGDLTVIAAEGEEEINVVKSRITVELYQCNEFYSIL